MTIKTQAIIILLTTLALLLSACYGSSEADDAYRAGNRQYCEYICHGWSNVILYTESPSQIVCYCRGGMLGAERMVEEEGR